MSTGTPSRGPKRRYAICRPSILTNCVGAFSCVSPSMLCLLARPIRGKGFALPSGSNGVCGLADHVQHDVRIGQHGNMTAGCLDNSGPHTLRDKALKVRMNRTVLG